MASSSDVSSLVEHLAETEQLLSGGSSVSGSNSGVAGEERDSIVEATAEMDELERSTVDRSSSLCETRSEVGSDTSRLQASVNGSVDGLLADQADALPQIDDGLPFGPGANPKALSLWQRLHDAKKAFMASDSEILEMQSSVEAICEAKNSEISTMQQELEEARQEKSLKMEELQHELDKAREMKDNMLSKMHQKLKDARIVSARNMIIQKSQLGRERHILKKQLEAAEQKRAKAQAEKEILKANVLHMQKTVSALKGKDSSCSSNVSEDDEEPPLVQPHPEDDTHDEARDDVAPLPPPRRGQMEVGDLRMVLSSQLLLGDRPELGGSTSPSSQLSSQLVGRQAVTKWRKKAASSGTKLAVIEEPDDLDSCDGSSYSGGLNVSSAAGGAGVADLRDFEEVPVDVLDLIVDENELLQEVVEVEKKKAQELEATVAAKEVKIETLKETLNEVQEELEAAKETVRAVCEVPERREWTPQQSKIEELTEQLNALREANRIAEARAVDLMRALRSEELKHKREKDELVQKLQGSARHNADDVNSEISKLRESLRSMQQEKNVLVNDFEWKELQWTTKIENAQLEVEDLKRRLASEASMHQRRIEALEASAKEAMEASVSLSSFAQAEREPAIALGWLRCPVRSAGPPPVDKFAFCQETCWKVVTEISGIVALWCSANEHVIRQASREANRLWGSSMLEGQSVFSLASGPSSASWLKRALQSHQRIADMGREDQGLTGFIVRDLGSETFVSKGGDTFDASVITAHFPAEPGRGKQAGVLVILELQAALGGASGHAAGLGGGGQSSRSRGAPSSRGHRRGDGTSSEVSSVSPSDSASNVLGFTHSAW